MRRMSLIVLSCLLACCAFASPEKRADNANALSDSIGNVVGEEEAGNEDILLHETFDNCSGTGGNDGVWKGNVASSAFNPDLDGWESTYKYGGKQCARFGKGPCSIQTPLFKMSHPLSATFRMAPWATSTDKSVDIYLNGDLLEYIELEAGQWTEVTFEIAEAGTYYFELISGGRLFIDDFKLSRPASDCIETVERTPSRPHGAYTLQGQYVGTDTRRLTKGIYIINGKKHIVR